MGRGGPPLAFVSAVRGEEGWPVALKADGRQYCAEARARGQKGQMRGGSARLNVPVWAARARARKRFRCSPGPWEVFRALSDERLE